jgi:hypothetical protein
MLRGVAGAAKARRMSVVSQPLVALAALFFVENVPCIVGIFLKERARPCKLARQNA